MFLGSMAAGVSASTADNVSGNMTGGGEVKSRRAADAAAAQRATGGVGRRSG